MERDPSGWERRMVEAANAADPYGTVVPDPQEVAAPARQLTPRSVQELGPDGEWAGGFLSVTPVPEDQDNNSPEATE